MPALALSVLLPALARPGEEGGAPGAPEPDAATTARVWSGVRPAPVRAAIDRALAFLARKQLGSGAIGGRFPVAVTSLAGLAILGAGYRADGGPYTKTLNGAIGFLKRSLGSPPGYIADDKSRMHGHSYAVLFLTQIHGELRRDEQSEVGSMIRDGVALILDSQTKLGGWYYLPRGLDPDGGTLDEASLTICALQALRAANGIGFVVPKDRIDKAISYIHRCKAEDGSFKYSLTTRDAHRSYALTVAAVSALHAAGAYDAEDVREGIDYARREIARRPSDPMRAAGKEFFFYANFYAAQAFYQAGGEVWATWYPAAVRYLLERQGRVGDEAGSWDDDYGPEFGTAMAALILEVPLGYLPIFQR